MSLTPIVLVSQNPYKHEELEPLLAGIRNATLSSTLRLHNSALRHNDTMARCVTVAMGLYA